MVVELVLLLLLLLFRGSELNEYELLGATSEVACCTTSLPSVFVPIICAHDDLTSDAAVGPFDSLTGSFRSSAAGC